jgi:hypothetical protein
MAYLKLGINLDMESSIQWRGQSIGTQKHWGPVPHGSSDILTNVLTGYSRYLQVIIGTETYSGNDHLTSYLSKSPFFNDHVCMQGYWKWFEWK